MTFDPHDSTNEVASNAAGRVPEELSDDAAALSRLNPDSDDDRILSLDRSESSVSPVTQIPGDGDGGLAVSIDRTLVYRSPPRVTAALRYALANGDMPPRVAVTSAIHGEGVSAVSRGLAALIAHDWGREVCWVDLNWWKGSEARATQSLFGASIVDYLNGWATVNELCTPTSNAGLSMITAGTAPVSARAMLTRNARLRTLLDDLSERFDHLVFDLPPVLTTSDTITLGGLADGYLLVVRQRATPASRVKAAIRAMNANVCLGTVLNFTRNPVPRWLRTSSDAWSPGGHD